MTERELMDRARRGDQRAFEQLVRDNEKRIYGLALRMTGDPEDAMDLSQEAFLNAWRGLRSFKGDSTFSTWLYRLTCNACIDHLRRQKRRRELLSTVSLEDEEQSVQLPDQRFAPEEALERQELRRALERAMARLPEEQRQVLVLRELEGLSYRELSSILGLEEGTVKSRLARARGAVRKILQEEGNFFSRPASKEDSKSSGSTEGRETV